MAMIHMEPQTLQLFERVLGTLKPPPNLTLSQWADKYRRLSAEASSAKGQWNTDNAPFQREIMDAIGDVHIRKVVAMMCAQAGKTEGLILNTVGFYMSYYPAPIMIVQPTVNLGESFSKDRLATMIRDTPILRGLVDNKSRYSGNTITKKNFPGGQLTIIGANSPTDLRGRPIKVLLADEVDILNHREHLTNAVSNGRPSGGTWYDSTVELPNENMMYGSHIFAPASDGTNIPNNYTISKSQLPLFRLAPWLSFTRSYWCWLRDVVSAASFANAGGYGSCRYYYASGEAGVRPVAGLIG